MSTYVKRGRPATDPAVRFWSKVDRSDDCWRYLGSCEPKTGRGKVSWGGTITSASLVAWELIHGRKPNGNLRNKCGNPGCCNPAHWQTKPKPRPKPSYEDVLRRRIRAKVKIVNGCWIWQRAINKVTGYSHISAYGKSTTAHRLSYRLFKGEIPEGTEIDHLCRVRACCNPDHLEAVTHRVNLERSPLHIMFNDEFRYLAGSPKQTHCKNGHELTPENRGHHGRCKTCSRRYVAETAARKKNDPAYQERQRATRLARYARNRTDPAFCERERERNRRYYARTTGRNDNTSEVG